MTKRVYLYNTSNSELLSIIGVFDDSVRGCLYFTFKEDYKSDSNKGFNENNFNNIIKQYPNYKLLCLEQNGNFLTDYYEIKLIDHTLTDRIDLNF